MISLERGLRTLRRRWSREHVDFLLSLIIIRNESFYPRIFDATLKFEIGNCSLSVPLETLELVMRSSELPAMT